MERLSKGLYSKDGNDKQIGQWENYFTLFLNGNF